jgi:hypothetical protein
MARFATPRTELPAPQCLRFSADRPSCEAGSVKALAEFTLEGKIFTGDCFVLNG